MNFIIRIDRQRMYNFNKFDIILVFFIYNKNF